MDKNDSTANRLSVNEDLRSLMEDIETHLNPVEIDVSPLNVGFLKSVNLHALFPK